MLTYEVLTAQSSCQFRLIMESLFQGKLSSSKDDKTISLPPSLFLKNDTLLRQEIKPF